MRRWTTPTRKHRHQPQTAALVICPEYYRAPTERTVSMETDKLIEALRCCGIRVGDKNCGECPVCATEEIKCPELMTLAADKLEKLNDFSQTQTAKLLGHIAKKDIEINRLSQLAMMREGDIGDRDRELAEKDKQLAAAVEDLRGLCWCCAHGKKWDKAPTWSNMTTCEHIRARGSLAVGGGKAGKDCPHWEWRGPQEAGEGGG